MDSSNQADRVRREGLGSLSVLPDAVLSVITFYLDIRTVCKLAFCSRLLRAFAYEPCLWMHLALSGHDGPLAYQTNWRQTALLMLHQAASVAAQTSAGTEPPAAANIPADIQQQQLRKHLSAAVTAAARPTPPVQGFQSEFLYRRWYRSNVDLSGFVPPVDQVPRVHHGALDPESFARLYDKTAQPVIFTGFMDAEWPSGWQQHWELSNLATAYPTATLQASRPSGGKTMMRLPDYVEYMARQADEEPLYIFDERFGEAAPGMLEWYKAPSVIPEDLTTVLSGSNRPDYRWLVIGPARAGASWHVDPALTSAWNSLTSGMKRWALYPPHVKPPGLQDVQQQQQRPTDHNSQKLYPSGMASNTADDSSSSSSSGSSWCTVGGSECESDDGSSSSGSSSSSAVGDDQSAGSGLTSLQWYLEVYPYLKPHQRPYEFTQYPGETVYIPGGWWHLVLNLKPSVAVTQNFVTTANFDRVVGQLAVGSRAYEHNVLGFYELDCQPWVADWQQHQRQQWQSWQQQQQQQGSGSVSDLAPAHPAAAAGASITADSCDPPAAAAAAALCITYTTCQSPYGNNVTSGSITCHASSAAASTDSSHHQQAPPAAAAAAAPVPDQNAQQSDQPWAVVLECIMGHQGYRRSNMLGPWLRQLWQQQQQRQPAMDEVHSRYHKLDQMPAYINNQMITVAKKYLGQQEWQQLLLAICNAHHIPSSSSSDTTEQQQQQCFPDVGSDSLVFHVGNNTVVKFLVGQDEIPAHLSAAIEARLLHALQEQCTPAAAAAAAAAGVDGIQSEQASIQCTTLLVASQQQQQQQQQQCIPISTSQLLGHGTVRFANCISSSSSGGSSGSSMDDVICCVPYLVLSKAVGDTAAADLVDHLSQQQQQQLAVACGQFLAQMHSLPIENHDLKSSSSIDTCPCDSRQQEGYADRSNAAAAPAAAAAGSHVQQQQQAGCITAAPEQLALQLINHSVWRDREGTVWSSQLGCLDQQRQQQLLLLAAPADDTAGPATAAAAGAMDLYALQLHESAAATAAAAGNNAEIMHGSNGVYENAQQHYAWWPFTQYLQQRKSDLLQQLAADQADLENLGSVAAEVYRCFPAAADQLAEMQQQQQQAKCIDDSSQISSSSRAFPVIGIGEDRLPSWLVQQIGGYLPEDMSQMLCHATHTAATAAAGGGCNASSSRRPVWLHGDLMAGNLLLKLKPQQQQQQQQQQLTTANASLAAPAAAAAGQYPELDQQQQELEGCKIEHISVVDFSDGGVGDPLYDFVAVFVSVLHCDVELLKLAVATYSSSMQHLGQVNSAAPGAVHQHIQQNRTDSTVAEPCAHTPVRSGTSDSSSRRGGSSSNVAKVFLVYLLLHEEGVMGQLLERHPHLRCAGSLEVMEQQLFGWMNTVWPLV